MFNAFSIRHIGPTQQEIEEMLAVIGCSSLEQLIDETVPESIRLNSPLNLENGITEQAALNELRQKLSQNVLSASLLGLGYHNCTVPPVIKRCLFENPAWYTSYTPYQAEISQGRLELLFHFQTLVSELTGLAIANSSLLDEGTAIVEGIAVAYRLFKGKRNKVIIANAIHPHNLDVIHTRCTNTGIKVIAIDELDEEVCALVIQTPDTYGLADIPELLIAKAKALKVQIIAACDPMALLMMEKPADWGVDIAVGSMQRYGVPMGNGGPHAAYMAVGKPLMRLIPGRMVGLSIDSKNRPAYRLALQTREQHIRREKAMSNICTSQALLANMVAAYAIWHGPSGLVDIAKQINQHAANLAKLIDRSEQYTRVNQSFFDTITFKTHENCDNLISRARAKRVLIRKVDDNTASVCFDECTNQSVFMTVCDLLNLIPEHKDAPLQLTHIRDDAFLSQQIFHQNRSETCMMRFLRQLMDKDLALDRAMIPLGSCTMKLNAAAEMIPISWRQVANIHPFAPNAHLSGYHDLINDLDRWLAEVTGFAKVSFQPNAGSQGEYAGLLAIKNYHQQNSGKQRNICLIPQSAHGTNPASALMAGLKVVVVACDSNGNVSVDDLKHKANEHAAELAALMITYPSTHGVFEESIVEICDTIHQYGGQVYCDGANLNALVGIAKPAKFGADVCHMNLHKTFCIPHGGGGPGVGPIGVAKHLVPFLPDVEAGGSHVSSAPYGSASILPISWMYVRMMGGDGLTEATKVAILNANYIATQIDPICSVLYQGRNGRVAHECIIDTRQISEVASVDDVAKRLIDYGFHAPTMSWPVIGTLMIEPTESESKVELDRFISAIKNIFDEAKKIAEKCWSKDDNPLHNAPHTAEDLTHDEWTHPYSRKVAMTNGQEIGKKYWAPVSRVDNVYGDSNIICSCPPLNSYKSI